MESLDREDLKKALRGQTIHQFDHKNVRELIKEINKKLEVIQLTYGVKIKFGKFKFDAVSFKSKIEGTILCDHSGKSAEKVKWDSLCSTINMKSTDWGKQIVFPKDSRFANMTGTLFGINTKARRYPILIKLDDGRLIKTSAVSVAKLIK